MFRAMNRKEPHSWIDKEVKPDVYSAVNLFVTKCCSKTQLAETSEFHCQLGDIHFERWV